MVATKTIELPFSEGLSQKTDALWLQPGSASVAQNLVKLKTGSLAKRLGCSGLAQVGQIPPSGTGNAVAATLTSGKRLLSYNNALTLIGQDAWTDAIWSFDDASAQPLLLDRTPETYVYPPTMIAGTSPNPGAAVPCARTIQTDTAVLGGYEMHVWSVGDLTSGFNASLWYELRNATTGAVVIPAQLLVPTGAHSGGVDVPKLIAVTTSGGPVFVLTYSSTAGDANIYATVFNIASFNWGAETRINAVAGDAAYPTGIWSTPPYDTCASIGETGFMGLVYEQKVAGNPFIGIVRLAVSTTAVTISSSGSAAVDALWNADTNPPLQGFALRVDAGNNECAFVYSWTSAAPLTRVDFQILTWPLASTVATPINLLSSPGPITAATINAAIVIAIERLGSVSGLTQAYKVDWSPGQTTFRQGDAASAYPFIASYVVSQVAGGAIVATNQPRVTWNVALASRIVLQNGVGYVVGYVPSDLQGSHFLLADDALTDITTPNSVGFNRGYFPMRLVGNLTPRQASVQSSTQAMMGLTTAQWSRVATHWPQNPSYQGNTGTVYQTLIPKDNSPITSAPTLFPIDFASTQSYAPSQLGQNAILSGGCPSAFDGTQCFELGFPHYPVFKLTLSGTGGTGNFNYIAQYQWTDGAGQLHKSARSVPTATPTLANQGVVITCAIPGFSARMKAINAAGTAGSHGPQSGLPVRRNILVYLYRTTNGGTVYFQCHAPIPVQLDSPTVTITDDFTLSSDANLVKQPLLYGDGSDGTQPGNVLDDECPPAFQHAIVHNNRIYGIAGSDVWMSKEFTTFAGAGFNEATAFSVDDGPGPLTALASMDGNLVPFKSDRIFLMSGQGPADNGTDNDLTPPSRITSDVGCLDWRSIVASKDGVYFQSQAGRRLLTRDLQVQPVPVVEDLDAANPVVTSAIVHPSAGRILWTQNTDDVTAPRIGVLIVNDYILESWTSIPAIRNQGFVSAVVANATNGSAVGLNYYGMTAAGKIWRENVVNVPAGPYTDGGTFVSSVWTSPWIKSDGLTGWSQWQMIRLLLTLKDPANITVTVAYDYVSTPTQTYAQTAAQIAAQIAPGLPQVLLEIRPTNQRAAAMQISISDSTAGTTVTGQGFLLESLRVDYGVEPGGYRAPTSQQG